MISLVQLSYIIAVDNYRHFASAAKKCFITQPTLSMQIQKLEEQLGVIIFDRSKQPVIPTDIGKEIIKQARKVLQEAARIEDIVNIYTKEISGSFKVGIIPTVAPYLLPLFLENFIDKYPNVQLTIDEIQTAQIVEKLQNEEIDLGIMATPLHIKDLIEETIYYEPFVAYIPPQHKLSKKKKLIAKDISQSELLLLQEGHCFRGQALQLCGDSANSNSEKSVRFEAGNLETLKKLVEQNFGITLLPYLASKEMKGTKKENLVKEFSSPVPKREISIVFHRAYLKKHIIEAFKNEIINSLPKELSLKPGGIILEI